MASVPNEPPPSYSQATGSSASNSRPAQSNQSHNDHLSVPGSSIEADRASIEDLNRPLPPGWVRTYDPKQHHQFFVDTTQDPPRSIWKHPYDDETYLRTLTNAERERIQQENAAHDRDPHSRHNAIYYDSDEDEGTSHQQGSSSSSNHNQTAELPPRPSAKEKPSLGRKLKDKLTGMTHEERAAERQRRAEAERQEYEKHLRFRKAMQRAIETGQPQLLGRDQNGKEVYVEPPSYQQGYPGAASRTYGANAYGINPYAGGMYAPPADPYMRGGYPYGRGYGYGGYGGGYRGGFGGGYGLPLALGGGLLGGMLLGDMMMF